LLVLGGWAFSPPIASAWGIESPPGNIKCGDGQRGAVVCIVEKQSFVEARECNGLYTVSAAVSRRGRASKNEGCFSGQPFLSANSRVLPYGRSTTHNEVTCRSTKTGLRCSNRDGHGFKLSRKALQRFAKSGRAASARTTLACFPARRVRPRTCAVFDLPGAVSRTQRIPLTGLRWSSWGGAQGAGSGRLRRRGRNVPVRVIASGRLRGRDAFFYSRLLLIDDAGNRQRLNLEEFTEAS